ncbi:MAG: glycosyltransferase family 4 protein [bacterium]|nr:glycosyltransferase family 4 protein [bacterium]
MRLLICTQAVDRRDPTLGFFHRWIEEFSKHCEQVEVICLRKGDYGLPVNVHVHALRSKNKIGRALELIRLSMSLEYDTVFVHMNPEYLVAAVWLWKLLGKKVALWYTHKSVDLKLRIAEKFVDSIFTASSESFRLPSKKVRVMGHGIDTDFFTPDPRVVRGSFALSVGRLTKSKRHDLAILSVADAGRELRIAGEGSERAHLESLAQELTARVQFLGGLTQAQLRDEYRKAAYLVHASETGSLDKVVLEALACGLPVRTNDPNLAQLPLDGSDPAYIREHHSLQKLIPAIVEALTV